MIFFLLPILILITRVINSLKINKNTQKNLIGNKNLKIEFLESRELKNFARLLKFVLLMTLMIERKPLRKMY